MRPVLGSNLNHVVMMRWERSVSTAVSTNTTAVTEFNANNINDIINQSTPTQNPIGYDQWRAFYSLFEVISTTCQVQLTNNGTEQVNVALVPSVETGISSSFSSFALAAEQRYAKRRMVGPSTGISNKTMTMKMNTRKIFGARRTETSPFVSAFGNNSPVKQWVYVIVAQNANETGVNGFDLIVKVTLTFAVRLHGRKQLFPLSNPFLKINSTKRKKVVPLFKIEEKSELKDDTDLSKRFTPVHLCNHIKCVKHKSEDYSDDAIYVDE